MATDEKIKHDFTNQILLGVPSKNGLCSHNFRLHLEMMQKPMNTPVIHLSPRYKPVDEARNMIVAEALKHNVKYILFIDDDVLVPPHTLYRFLNMAQREGKKVITGVYYTKTVPPVPVILNRGQPAGVTGWNVGDIFTVDFAGMGCMFVDTSIFEKMTEPYFKYQAFEFNDKNLPLPTIGEDIWFCDKVAKEVGEKIWVDTSIQCGHENAAIRRVFIHNEALGRGVCQDEKGIMTYVQSTEEAKFAPTTAKAGKKVCWGYDNELSTYEEAGTTKYADLRLKYIGIARAKVRNVLEFQRRDAAAGFLNHLWDLMADGAPVEVKVPDVVTIADAISKGIDDYKYINGMFGSDKNHFKSGYTQASLGQVLVYAGFTDVNIRTADDVLIATAKKGVRK